MHRGVIIEVMNLLKPAVYTEEKGKMLNSPMAIPTVPGGPRAEHWVSGDLFDSFGDILRVKKHYQVAASDEPALEEKTHFAAIGERRNK